MQIYRHALLLVENETDGLLLLEQAEGLAKEMGPVLLSAISALTTESWITPVIH